MSHNPIMLSDTAMVLLRQSVEASDHVVLLFADASLYIPGNSIPSRGYHNEIRALNRELMRDVWLSWTFRDLSIIRCLDWHISFDETLVSMAEKTFITPEEYVLIGPEFVTRMRDDSVNFIRVLHRMYRQTLRGRKGRGS